MIVLENVVVLCNEAERAPCCLAALVDTAVFAVSRSDNLKGGPRKLFKVREPGTVKVLEVLDDDIVEAVVLKGGLFRV